MLTLNGFLISVRKKSPVLVCPQPVGMVPTQGRCPLWPLLNRMSLGSISEFPEKKRQSGNIQRKENLEPGKQRFCSNVTSPQEAIASCWIFFKNVTVAFKIFKETLPGKKFGLIQNLHGWSFSFQTNSSSLFVSCTNKLVIPSRKRRTEWLCVRRNLVPFRALAVTGKKSFTQ